MMLVLKKSSHVASFTSVQYSQMRDITKENEEQSSCNKMHNVLTSYYHFREARV